MTCQCTNPNHNHGACSIEEIVRGQRIADDVDATLDFLSNLRAWKSDIAAMRRDGHHTSASIARDEMLCRVEAWLDPVGLERRAALQTEQGASALALSRAIDPLCGF